MKKNILLLYCFEPYNMSAYQRIHAFAQYLSEFDHNVYVVNLKSEHISLLNNIKNIEINSIQDKSFFKKINVKKNRNIFLHKISLLYNYAINFLTLDPFPSWTDQAIEKSKEIIKEKKIDVIISSFSPVSPHLVAIECKKSCPDIHWVADMRDEMSESPYIKTRTRQYYQKIEKEILEHCDSLLCVSTPILKQFRNMTDRKNLIFQEIRNGYNFTPQILEQINNDNSKWTIGYFGSFYGDIKPDYFFKALLSSKIPLDKVTINFFGFVHSAQIPDKLKGVVKSSAAIPYGTAQLEIKKQDILLLILPNNGRKGVYSGKLFDYLASPQPILALVDKGDVAAQLIVEANSGYITESNNLSEITETIEKAYNDWRNNIVIKKNKDVVLSQHRKKQVEKLNELLIR